MSNTKFTVKEDKKTLVIERTFAAPKSKVWSAYSEAEQLEQWWGPNGWKTQVKEMDFRTGGHWLYCMTCQDEQQTDWYGKTSCGKGVFESVNPQDSFAYTDYFTDESGNETPGMPTGRTVLDFTESGDTTTLTCTVTYDTEEALAQVLEMGMQEGLSQTWDRLDTFVQNQ